MTKERHEISDLIVSYDQDTLVRRLVDKEHVLKVLEENRQFAAARIVRRLPERGGALVNAAVDTELVRSHIELQRLHEEFQQGRRVLEVLLPLVRAVRAMSQGTLRVVDVGCGLGYVIRWLATRQELDGVELLGCDYNEALVDAARSLALREGLKCSFRVANAFRLEGGASIYLSSGVLHHFRGGDLVSFFQEQDCAGVHAFAHYDIYPSWLAPVGSYVFHRARMRIPLARYDGVVSAQRAHTSKTLLTAAREGAPGFALGLFAEPAPLFPILRIMRPLVGVRPALWEGVKAGLGRRSSLLRRGPA